MENSCGPSGIEWLVDARGCDPARLRSREQLEALLDDVIARLGLHVVGRPQWHEFPGAGGITALYLLSESHLSLHTFPEHGLATLNLYCCVPRPDWPWEARLRDALGATDVSVRRLPRGAAT